MILSFINSRKVPRGLANVNEWKIKVTRDLANVNEWKIMFDRKILRMYLGETNRQSHWVTVQIQA